MVLMCVDCSWERQPKKEVTAMKRLMFSLFFVILFASFAFAGTANY